MSRIRNLGKTINLFNQGCAAYRQANQAWEAKERDTYETKLLSAARDVPDALEWTLKIYLRRSAGLTTEDRAKLKTPTFHQLITLMRQYADPELDQEIIKQLYDYRDLRNESTHKGAIPSIQDVEHAIADVRQIMLTYLPIDETQLTTLSEDQPKVPVRSKNVVFVSYSHKDETEKEQVLAHLGVVERTGLIELWSDDRIGVGADWKGEIDQAIARARVAILLISANFLTSSFVLDEEIPALLQRHQQAGLTIIPFIAKSCAWRTVEWLARMQVRPRNGQPTWGGSAGQVDASLAALAEEVAQLVRSDIGDWDGGQAAPPVEVTTTVQHPPQSSETTRPHVFLSYTSDNESFVETLAGRLQADERFSFWFGPWHRIPGQAIQEQMEEALLAASACAVFIGGGGQVKGWTNEEMRLAIQNRVEDEPGYRVIPVLVPGVARPKRRDLPPLLRRHELVEFQSPNDEQAYKRLLAGILGIPPIEV